jgi:mRNA-degrading endonuclease toxin of MazEF toxin-antitoxin module
MTTYERGDVIVVNVPLTKGRGVKPRPALVVSARAFHQRLPDLLVCPISSQPRYYRRPGPGDYPLRHWKRVRLRYQSAVRVSKLLSIDRQIIKKKLGRIAKEDLREVDQQLRLALGLA